MGFQDYISEFEATSITGITGSTLNRFAEAGYLQIESDSDGLRLYSKAALLQLFGAERKEKSGVFEDRYSGDARVADLRGKTADLNSIAEESLQVSTPPVSTEEHSIQTSSIPQECASPSVNDRNGEESTALEIDDTPGRPEVKASPLLQKVEKAVLPTEITAANVVTPDPTPLPTSKSSATPLADKQDRDFEIFRMQKILEMQDKLLDMKDRELKDLREQRDWLKERVQKLEEKSDRDQLILLSETQTIRKLMALQEGKRSPLHMALEWLGLVRPAPTTNGLMIDISGRQGAPHGEKQSSNWGEKPAGSQSDAGSRV
jgi:hypothetical protein